MHRQDHPRLCGEKWHIGQSITRQKGSPPPMRGKAWKEKVKTRSIWITPAYAGKSSFHLASCFFCRDHPRLCGEKLKNYAIVGIEGGSPPPMRGKGIGLLIALTVSRITPAYAGKRAGHLKALSTERDHPRLCGEKIDRIFNSVQRSGSPPPMRGKAPK